MSTKIYWTSHAFNTLICCCVIFCSWDDIVIDAYELVINSPESAVLNSTVNVTATLFDNGKIASAADYRHIWSINTIPSSYSTEVISKLPYSTWTLSFPINTTKAGHYRLSVSVQKEIFWTWPTIASNEIAFEVSETLGGQMQLRQDGVLRTNLVSTKTPVNHTFTIPEYDLIYINKYANRIQTYWFQNNTMVGTSDGMQQQFVYNQTNQTYIIEALVIASIDLDVEPDVVTTTPATQVTTLPPNVSQQTTTKTVMKTANSTTNTTTTTSTPLISGEIKHKSKRDTSQSSNSTAVEHKGANDVTLKPVNSTVKQSPVHRQLLNVTALYFPPNTTLQDVLKTMDRNRTLAYGYYKREVVAKDPISNFTVDGKMWLQHHELTHLVIRCKGSETIQLCTQIYDAPYNATGQEICPTYFNQSSCHFNFLRYFAESKVVLFFIRNDISQTMNQVTINIYEAKTQSQLSVVVVPVSFTLVAIILAVFCIYYYIQSRHRFNVEVADFNFGETQSVDMEYKTFQQRLYESICEVLPQHWTRFQRFHDTSDGEYEQNGGHLAANSDNNTFYNTLS